MNTRDATGRSEADTRPVVVCIAGFGDNVGMFAPLLDTAKNERLHIDAFDLPGFGAPALDRTTLETLADALGARCRQLGARTVVAHSVASIIASLAAQRDGSPIRAIVSLEGNLTAEDAYFSGTAADYPDPSRFRAAFLSRLREMAEDDPIVEGYHHRVMNADPLALWELGCDARAFSERAVPGDVLMAAASVVYVLNPTNCPPASLAWLNAHDMERVVLEGASHWPTIDRPLDIAAIIQRAASDAMPAVG